MQTINIHAAKTQLSRLVEQAAAGEEIIIARAGRPICRLMPLTQASKPGTLAGDFADESTVPDGINAPSAQGTKETFYGEPVPAMGNDPGQSMISRFAGCWDDMSNEEFSALETERQQRRAASSVAFDGRRADAADAG